MLKPWPEYDALKQQTLNPPAYVDDIASALVAPCLVSLSDLHGSDDLWLLPAYAQDQYVYDNHAIIRVDAERYHHTPMIDRVNQFDAMGPSYGPNITDITIEHRLGKVTSAAQRIVTSEKNIMRADGVLTSGKLMVIDALRTVNSGYLMAAANPIALENKLLSAPGTSAHNKGMAVDLTLTYSDEARDAWCDADMLGHIDHPDMTTNHRNFNALSDIQRHNRLYLEQVMLRGAFENGILLAPLREEFWDFRFPEDGLDLWRVLESISRTAQIEDTFNVCSKAVEAIRTLYRSGNKADAYSHYELDRNDYQDKCQQLFSSTEATEKLKQYLHITPSELAEMEFVFTVR